MQGSAPAPAHYTIIDLGTLGGSFSLAYGINDNGQIDGFSTLPGDTVQHSFVIEKGVMTDLGTLGGANSESFANLNNAIQVAGTAETSVTDPNNENFCSFGTNLICLGFVWQNGIMTPLSTLGGSNGQAAAINNRGQVAGYCGNRHRRPELSSAPGAAIPADGLDSGTSKGTASVPGRHRGSCLLDEQRRESGGRIRCLCALRPALRLTFATAARPAVARRQAR